MRRLLFLTIIFSFFLSSQTAFADFSDVTVKTYYKKAIEWMADNGVIEGYPDGTFKPDKCVTRAEFLKMLLEASGVIFIPDENLYKDESPIKDITSGSWYALYVKVAYSLKIAQGYPGGIFKPLQCVNRVEAVKMAVPLFMYGERGGPPYEAKIVWPYDIAKDKNLEKKWYYQYLSYALMADLVGIEHFQKFNVGYGNQASNQFMNPRYNFEPEKPMTRKEVVEMFYRMKAAVNNNSEYYRDGMLPEYIVAKFDNCGKIADYKNREWYPNFVESALKQQLEVAKISDACFSENQQIFVVVVPGGYCINGNVFRYSIGDDAEHSLLEKASLIDKNKGCLAWPSSFGKREGKIIKMEGIVGDAGCEAKMYFDYNPKKNIIEFKKECSRCATGPEEKLSDWKCENY